MIEYADLLIGENKLVPILELSFLLAAMRNLCDHQIDTQLPNKSSVLIWDSCIGNHCLKIGEICEVQALRFRLERITEVVEKVIGVFIIPAGRANCECSDYRAIEATLPLILGHAEQIF